MYIVFIEKTKLDLLTNQSLLSQGVVDVALVKCHTANLLHVLETRHSDREWRHRGWPCQWWRAPRWPINTQQHCLMNIFFIFHHPTSARPTASSMQTTTRGQKARDYNWAFKRCWCQFLPVDEWRGGARLEKGDVMYFCPPIRVLINILN